MHTECIWPCLSFVIAKLKMIVWAILKLLLHCFTFKTIINLCYLCPTMHLNTARSFLIVPPHYLLFYLGSNVNSLSSDHFFLKCPTVFCFQFVTLLLWKHYKGTKTKGFSTCFKCIKLPLLLTNTTTFPVSSSLPCT